LNAHAFIDVPAQEIDVVTANHGTRAIAKADPMSGTLNKRSDVHDGRETRPPSTLIDALKTWFGV